MVHCETQTHFLSDDGTIPNNRLPLVVFRQCLHGEEAAGRRTLESNGWGGIWVNGIYDFDHFHSTAHEFLGILQGTGTLQLGGESGIKLDVAKGDVLVLPAGTGHKKLRADPDFSVMGAYPEGQTWDICRGKLDEHAEVRENISRVPLPKNDPLYGADGPLIQAWQSAGKGLDSEN